MTDLYLYKQRHVKVLALHLLLGGNRFCDVHQPRMRKESLILMGCCVKKKHHLR